MLQSSRNVPSSASCRMRSRAPMRRWWPQCGHTMRLARTSPWRAPCWHSGHTHSGLSGSLRRSISTVMLMMRCCALRPLGPGGDQPSYRLKTRATLWPPNPKLLLAATSTLANLACNGT
jgi:hypothetical protein